MNPYDAYLTYWEKLSVSRETVSRIEEFILALMEQNKYDNLISRAENSDIWMRHVIDSAQLIQFVPRETLSLMDIGSGGGFPGVIVALLKENLKIHLVESRGRKARFLQEMVEKFNLNAEIHHMHTKDLNPDSIQFNVITARAVSSLKELFNSVTPFVSQATTMIFPKGEKYLHEIQEAEKSWKFSIRIENSLTSDVGKILIINDLKLKSK
jgi:16S rRNA (guanine527-N7)-methyltransferase